MPSTRRRLLRVAALILLALVAPSSALAATTVTGAASPGGPLVIEPDVGPRNDSNYGKLFFIQKMPATKTINRVTLGDIALSSSCTATGPVLSLRISEHPTGAMGTETPATSWEGKALEQIPADYEFKRRTWRTEPITLVKGRGYSFNVTGTQSGCTSFEVRSWAHNLQKVNAGSSRCDRVMSSAWRMWHDTNANDAVTCGQYNSLPQDFHSSMPRGWLSVYSYTYPNNLVEVLRGNGTNAPRTVAARATEPGLCTGGPGLAFPTGTNTSACGLRRIASSPTGSILPVRSIRMTHRMGGTTASGGRG